MWKKLLKEKQEEFEEWYGRFKRHENFLLREFIIMPGDQDDWREDVRDKTETRVTLLGKKSIFKWKNFKDLFQKKHHEWWDMLPPKVPPHEYRVSYFDILKKWPAQNEAAGTYASLHLSAPPSEYETLNIKRDVPKISSSSSCTRTDVMVQNEAAGTYSSLQLSAPPSEYETLNIKRGFNTYSLLVGVAAGTLFMAILWVTTLLYRYIFRAQTGDKAGLIQNDAREEFEEWYGRFKRHENFLRREFVIMPGDQDDWREDIRDKTETRVTLRGKKSIFKWKNFKGLVQKKQREWWDMLPPKVPAREYRVSYFDIPKKWPVRSLLLEKPDKPENYLIQSHITEIHLVKPVMIDFHTVVCQSFEKSEAGPSETGEDQRSAAASDDEEEYFSLEE
ncbi:myelin-associated glyco [Labeo rohita]|uniref:Myelin-associated glyco n=2 Tax=Labeo rohita TaxID=84645 RepID=A0A498LYR4_LABRO|nr:myelin-associated glyco [Labeo rohita]